MNDPYEKAFKNVMKGMNLLRDMIVELASRTLTIKEYQDFAETLNKQQEEAHE